ncbi:hypothetical protein [Sphingomonas sp. LM7]|uniref:hypothetical protein n=1 Tax=Sphingomonas sp. LM7 TaxID=1938607 RepID=UPI000983CCB3|nr:hypothetical protein [Sphingomonas sp. LM7]AQR74415.1 hypothetical protein BXU08_12810 [Sphingomonas sp. LM7]
MSPLSGIFSDDSESSSNSSDGNLVSDVTGDVSSTIGLDANNSSESWSQDEDGNQSYDSSDTGIGLDTSTDGLLGSVTDAMGSSDQSSSD